MSEKNSLIARDFLAIFPLILAGGIATGFFVFLFYVFSGAVDLKDATVSALVGATISSLVNVPLTIVLTHVFTRGRFIEKKREEEAP